MFSGGYDSAEGNQLARNINHLHRANLNAGIRETVGRD